MTFYLLRVTGAVIDGAMIDQRAVLVKEIAFGRAAGAKGICKDALAIQRIIPIVALSFGIGLHRFKGIAAVAIAFIGVEQDDPDLMVTGIPTDLLCPRLVA